MEDKKVGDILKKVVNSGISAALGAEDTVKNLLQDLPIPKEIVQGLLDNAKNAKTDFIDSVKTELRSYLDKVDLSKEIDRVLQNYDIEVNAKFKITPKKTKTTKSKK